MTNQDGGDGSGPSLFQARGTSSSHTHNHNHQHLHLHQHRRLHPTAADTTSSPHIRSPPNKKQLHDRQVVIVQTVSVVHYIDATGDVTSVETLTSSDPVARTTQTTIDVPAAVSAGLTALGDVLPSVSLSGLLSDLTDGPPSTTSSAQSETSASSSLSASSATLTSTLSSSSSAFPTLSSVFNSSSTSTSSLSGNHTIALFSNSTRTSTFSPSTFTSTLTSTSTESSDSLWTFTSDDFTTPTAVAGGGDSGNGGAAAVPSVSVAVEPTPEPSSSPGLPPETRNAVVGGVVGSVAGVALVALFFLYLLKWRRQRGHGLMLLRDVDSTARGRGSSSGGPASPGSGRGMMERAGAFAIPSALAKLTGKRALDTPASEPAATQEKGFYRVSGKKLISVLESGGDGYSDPHDSIGSASSFYRDSNGFSDSSNSAPLQLGSPMRPVSGVPVFRDGPQRTPVHEDGPLPPSNRRSEFPTTLRAPDPVGRSFASRDGSRGSGSRGSGSRFTEDA